MSAGSSLKKLRSPRRRCSQLLSADIPGYATCRKTFSTCYRMTWVSPMGRGILGVMAVFAGLTRRIGDVAWSADSIGSLVPGPLRVGQVVVIPAASHLMKRLSVQTHPGRKDCLIRRRYVVG